MAKKKRVFREWQHPRDHRGRFARRGSPAWVARAGEALRAAGGDAANATRGADARPRIARAAKATAVLHAHTIGGRPTAVRAPQATITPRPAPAGLAGFNAPDAPRHAPSSRPHPAQPALPDPSMRETPEERSQRMARNLDRVARSSGGQHGRFMSAEARGEAPAPEAPRKRTPRPAPGAAALIAARAAEQAPHAPAMAAARTAPETAPVPGAENYAQMRRHTLIALARDAGVSVRGRSNTDLANALAAHDEQVRAQRAARLNPSGVGSSEAPQTAPRDVGGIEELRPFRIDRPQDGYDAHGRPVRPGDTVTIATDRHNRTDERVRVLEVGTGRTGGSALATVQYANGDREQLLLGNLVRTDTAEGHYLDNLTADLAGDARAARSLRGQPSALDLIRSIRGESFNYQSAALRREAGRHRGQPLGERLNQAADDLVRLGRGTADGPTVERALRHVDTSRDSSNNGGMTPTTPPAPAWVDARTGRPVANPSQVDIVRGNVRRDVPAEAPTPAPAAPRKRISSDAKRQAITPQLSEQQRAIYGRLLGTGDGDTGLVQNPHARRVVEQMEQHGWQVVGQDPMMHTVTFRAPDGREMRAQFLLGSSNGKPRFYLGQGMRTQNLSFKAAMQHVVTPPLEAPDRPSVGAALERVNPEVRGLLRNTEGLGNFGGPGLSPDLMPLARIGRMINYNDPSRHTDPAEVANELRREARARRELADTVRAQSGLGFASDREQRAREAADLFDRVADEMDRLGREHAAYEVERDRRAAAPLDIRPGRLAKAVPAKAAPRKAAPRKAAAPAALAEPQPEYRVRPDWSMGSGAARYELIRRDPDGTETRISGGTEEGKLLQQARRLRAEQGPAEPSAKLEKQLAKLREQLNARREKRMALTTRRRNVISDGERDLMERIADLEPRLARSRREESAAAERANPRGLGGMTGVDPAVLDRLVRNNLANSETADRLNGRAAEAVANGSVPEGVARAARDVAGDVDHDNAALARYRQLLGLPTPSNSDEIVEVDASEVRFGDIVSVNGFGMQVATITGTGDSRQVSGVGSVADRTTLTGRVKVRRPKAEAAQAAAPAPAAAPAARVETMNVGGRPMHYVYDGQGNEVFRTRERHMADGRAASLNQRAAETPAAHAAPAAPAAPARPSNEAIRERYARAADRVARLDDDDMSSRESRAAYRELREARAALTEIESSRAPIGGGADTATPGSSPRRNARLDTSRDSSQNGGGNAPTTTEANMARTAASTGTPQLGVTESSRGRTTTVTLPDGTTAQRTSRTRAYTHAVVASRDLHAEARDFRATADVAQRYADAYEAWIQRGANLDELVAVPNGSGSVRDDRAGLLNYSHYLPGFPPIEHRTRHGSRYTTTAPGTFIITASQRHRSGQGDFAYTDYEGYANTPANNRQRLQEARADVERLLARAAELEAGPQHEHYVARWSQRPDSAFAAIGSPEVSARNTTYQVVGVGGTARQEAKPAKVVPTAAEKAAAAQAKKDAEKAERAARTQKFFDDKIKNVTEDLDSDDPARALRMTTEQGIVSLAKHLKVKVANREQGPYGSRQRTPEQVEKIRQDIVKAIRERQGKA